MVSLRRVPLRRPHPFAELLGIEAAVDDDGEHWLVCDLSARHHNPNGVAHGGVAYALLDTAMGAATFKALGGPGVWATIELKVNYLASAEHGTLRARAHAVHIGRSTVVLQGEVLRDDGKAVAVGLGTFLILQRPPIADTEPAAD
jgi:acyl-CoA thioesterase